MYIIIAFYDFFTRKLDTFNSKLFLSSMAMVELLYIKNRNIRKNNYLFKKSFYTDKPKEILNKKYSLLSYTQR